MILTRKLEDKRGHSGRYMFLYGNRELKDKPSQQVCAASIHFEIYVTGHFCKEIIEIHFTGRRLMSYPEVYFK